MIKKLISFIKDATFLKFCVVGTLNTLIDVGVLQLLLWATGIDPKTSPLLFVFVCLAFGLAVVNGFVLNKLWTFRLRTRRNTTRQFIKFIITNLLGLALTLFFMFIFVQVLHIEAVIAKLLTSGLVLVWNFFATKHWTFKERRLDKILHKQHADDVLLSVIVPAYNEEERIIPTLERILAYLREAGYRFELLIADDGSRDATRERVNAFIAKEHLEEDACLVALPQNRGKGAAVRAGVLRATGQYILFTDADNSTPIEELGHFMEEIDSVDMLIGSRYLKTSDVQKKQPWYRIALSRTANLVIQAFLIDGIRDTQCGFKLFHYAAAKDIFSRMQVDGFGFDMELLALADVLDYRVKELPVLWIDSPNSRVRPVKEALRTLGDLVTIKLNIWTGKYRLSALTEV